MFYSQVILAKKGPLAKVWLAAHWGDKKLARPQIFATDISQSCTDIMNPSVPLALRLSGHLLLGVVRIYSRKVKYVLNDCTEAMLKLQMAFAKQQQQQQQQLQLQQHNQQHQSSKDGNAIGRELLITMDGQQQQQNNQQHHNQQQLVQNFGEFDQVHVVEGFCLPLPEDNEWILADDDDDDNDNNSNNNNNSKNNRHQSDLLLAAHLPTNNQVNTYHNNDEEEEEEEETWAPFDPDNENDEDNDEIENENENKESRVSDIEIVRAANESFLSEDQVSNTIYDTKPRINPVFVLG